MTSKAQSIFFAVSWHHGYGVTWISPSGRAAPGRNLHAFASRSARDAWVAEGATPKSAPDYREKITRIGMTARERTRAAESATPRSLASVGHVEVW